MYINLTRAWHLIHHLEHHQHQHDTLCAHCLHDRQVREDEPQCLSYELCDAEDDPTAAPVAMRYAGLWLRERFWRGGTDSLS